jgi:hypothetical protein
VLAHVVTSAVPTAADATRRRHRNRRSVRASDGLR